MTPVFLWSVTLAYTGVPVVSYTGLYRCSCGQLHWLMPVDFDAGLVCVPCGQLHWLMPDDFDVCGQLHWLMPVDFDAGSVCVPVVSFTGLCQSTLMQVLCVFPVVSYTGLCRCSCGQLYWILWSVTLAYAGRL